MNNIKENLDKDTEKRTNQSNILVHLHMYYPKQLNYMLKKLKNINSCKWDLVVTICDENTEIERKIKAFKPDAKFIKVNNVGYDVWPFIQALKQVDLDNYDYVLKIHTKNGRQYHNYIWRNVLVDSLLESQKRFKQNLELFENNPNIGVIGADEVMSTMTGNCTEENDLFWQFCEKHNLDLTKGAFISGTMFIIRANILKQILALNLKEEDFIGRQQTNGTGTLAHVLERVFGRISELQGYTVYTVENPKYFFYFKFNAFLKRIFAIQNRHYNGKKYKQINVLGFKIKICKGKDK